MRSVAPLCNTDYSKQNNTHKNQIEKLNEKKQCRIMRAKMQEKKNHQVIIHEYYQKRKTGCSFTFPHYHGNRKQRIRYKALKSCYFSTISFFLFV